MNIRTEHKEQEVLECIDRPIRPLVLELNRIGLRTKWSCCGFSYKEEKVKKTHSNQPFIVFYPPQTSNAITSFFALGKIVAQSYWMFRPYHPNGEWHMMGQSTENKFYHREPDEVGLHDYETALINIQYLTKLIKKWPSIPKDSYTLEDGNKGYDKLTNGEWQIKPAKDSVIQIKDKSKKDNENI